MRHHPDEIFIDAELEASLERLGVQELEERMELSPLLADPGVGDADGCTCSCRCDSVPPEGDLPSEFDISRPETALPDGIR